MKTAGDRIKEERIAKGWSQQRLADEISKIKNEKITRNAIALWESGSSKTQKPENMFAAAKALGLNPQWVLDETGEKRAAIGIPHESDYSTVAQLHANGSCGDGYLNDHVEVRGSMAFKRDWLARMSIDPEQAGVIYARGDSMQYTISDGEVLLVDYRQCEPFSSKVYVINVDGNLRVKRLFKRV